MIHYNLKDVPSEINKRGIQMKRVVDHAHATINNLILLPGDKIPAHETHVDVTFFVLEGKGEITIGEETFQVVQNDIVLCKPNTPMSISANQGTGLIFLNLKTPGINV